MILQGYDLKTISEDQDADLLIRWTPFSCALFGTMGMMIQNPWYFIILGALTMVGGFGSRSFYDYLYNATLRHIFQSERTPLHGKQRRFGCAVGACLYIAGGVGFFIGNVWLFYIPTLFIIFFAWVVAITQWCFASSLYNLIRGRKEARCC